MSAPDSGESLTPARQREILREALHAYDQAVAVAREEPARAAELYRQAAVGLDALADAGVRNPAVEYDLGNLHFRLGDHGGAILHYRRAQRLGGRDADLTANLRYVRERVEPRVAPSGHVRLTRQLLFWHYDTSLPQRFIALVLCSAIGWPLLFIWLRRRQRALFVTGVVAVAAALAAGASLRWELDNAARRPHAVLIAPHTPLRLARGESSDLALKQPLGAGMELRILQERGGWVEVRLPDDQTGWLPTDAVERV
jgi:tetratricopeptide (TPR) repeat protein